MVLLDELSTTTNNSTLENHTRAHMRIRVLVITVPAVILMLWTAPSVGANTAPPPAQPTIHIELGIGIAGAHFADYPGASRYWNLLLPIPYITVHTPHLDANREGVTGKLFHNDRWTLNVDFSASVPVDSLRDAERGGMPNLGWIGETGPILKYRIWSDEHAGLKLEAGLPLRVAVSTDGWQLHHRGWVVEPWIELSRKWGQGDREYHADFTLSSLYATGGYFNYIYGVAPPYATPTRPAYIAGSGRGGYRVSLGFGWRHGDMVFGAFYRYINLGGASFNASPLVSQRHQNAFGIAIAWVLRKFDY
ncbi:MAG: MipA/OmpV family protein [Gammaproteobacteria bacterium]